MEQLFPVWNNNIDLQVFFVYAYAKVYREVLFVLVGICDDNQQDREALTQLIQGQHCCASVKIVVFSSLCELEHSKQKPDILFLDIEVGEENSIEYFHRSNALRLIPVIVLVSSYTYYVTSAFTISVDQYILKPIRPEIFKKVFSDCCRWYMQLQQYCEVSLDNQEKRTLHLSQIAYIQSENRKLVYTDILGQKYSTGGSLQLTENRLQQFGFCRIHKSYLVNLMFVTELPGKNIAVQLAEKKVFLPVGNAYSDIVRKQYLKYLVSKGVK